MDNVDGRILWDQTLPDYEPSERRKIYEAKVKTFADLHNTDYKKVGLQDFGKEGDYCARQIHRWTKQYKASETMHIPEMEQLIDWLPKNLPTKCKILWRLRVLVRTSAPLSAPGMCPVWIPEDCR